MDIIKEHWEEILYTVKMEHELTDVSFNAWLKPLEIHSFEKSGNTNTLYILVPNEQIAIGYISKKYTLPLRVAIAEITGMDCELEFILPEEAQRREARQAAVSSNLNESIEKANLNPKYTFDTFVVGSNNNFAHAASLAVAESPGEMYNPLFIYGGVGLGKTHLMHSIAHFILERNPDAKVLYVTSESFTNELIEAIRNNNNTATARFREKYRNIDVLLIDDIQFIIGKESTQEEFFHTFNTLYNAGKQIVLATDRPPKEIKSLEDRIRTRMEWGLIADIQPPDFETRVAIIRRKADLLGLDISDEVAEYIANNLKNNIRQLEGAVKKLNAYYTLEGIPPVVGAAQNAIKDILSESQPVPVTIEKIISEVARTYNISPADIRSMKRSSNVSEARQTSMYAIQEITGMTRQEIGREFGGRDHSTVVYAIKQVKKQMEKDPRYKEVVEDIIKNART